jgi:prevent-host-death family protein
MAGKAATVVDVHEAKTRLSRLLALAEAGEEVVIARGGKPVARLVSIDRPRPVRRFGAMRGRITIDDSFFEKLPEAELAAWE